MKLLPGGLKGKGKYLLAVSGGADSMAALDFLRTRRNVELEVINVVHLDETNFCYEASDLVKDYCECYDLTLHTIVSTTLFTSNREQEWRKERYEFIGRVQEARGGQAITAHHLDDALETYVMSFISSGVPKFIPYKRSNPNVIRPFLLNRKEDMRQYCTTKYVPYLEDPMNSSNICKRGYIRETILPRIEVINPGFYKQARRFYLGRMNEDTVPLL